MVPFRVQTGIVAKIPAANLNTDVIMPKQFLKGITREGLARGVFYDLRFHEDGTERPDFVLNRPEFSATKFLLVGPNFGCGSSREHAVWGLKQFGIRAVISTSYGSIFYDNCAQNALLSIVLQPEAHELLQRHCGEDKPSELTVDLLECRVTGEWGTVSFEVPPLVRERLLKGLDSISATLQIKDEIRSFEDRYLSQMPWIGPRVATVKWEENT